MTSPGPWVRLCQDCWQREHPDEYMPDSMLGYDTCASCGTDALVYGHRGPFTLTPPPQDRDGMTEPEALS